MRNGYNDELDVETILKLVPVTRVVLCRVVVNRYDVRRRADLE